MAKEIYFYLLIFCGIWSQGIIEVFANEEIKESSHYLVRQKRVVSHVPGEDIPIMMETAPYVALIKSVERIKCVGSILSSRVVITSEFCVAGYPPQYQIVSGQTTSSRGSNNNVIEIRRHSRIALAVVAHPFVFSINCYFIKLHENLLLPGQLATVSGWGFNWRCVDRGTNHPTKLRSIQVPIMTHRDCVNRYRPHPVISDKEICTFHSQRHCGHNDFGAGLVIDGHLAGVHIFTGLNETRINPEYPDVFAVLQHLDYSHWIRSNLQSISAQFQNHPHPLYPQHT